MLWLRRLPCRLMPIVGVVLVAVLENRGKSDDYKFQVIRQCEDEFGK